jgi:hypothetical protein
MNCGEAVKPGQYTVEAPRKQVPKRESQADFKELGLSAPIRENPWQEFVAVRKNKCGARPAIWRRIVRGSLVLPSRR